MRRPLLGLALLLGALTTAGQQASTGGNDLPAQSTAVHRATHITGATLLSVEYSMAGGTITAVSPRLRGILLLKVVTATFGDSAPVLCTPGAFSVVDVLTGLREATYTCAGVVQDADRPPPLRITAR